MYRFKHMLDGTFFTKTIFIAQFYQCTGVLHFWQYFRTRIRSSVRYPKQDVKCIQLDMSWNVETTLI